MKLAVFDFDSTLMNGETINFLAKDYGVEDEVKKITEKAMAGELDFFESLTYRIGLLKGMKVKRVDEICQNLPFVIGAKETITELKNRGYKVVCFSGGYKNATVPAKEKLGLDGEFSNILHSKNGALTGLFGGEMCFSDSKGQMLKTLQSILKIDRKNTVVIGDGANDLSMFQYADTRIAFCAKEVLKNNATIIIDKKDLREILKYL
ncbi:phosphoserine phosphatase SerB [bacterium]|nr:phosphoserine phosphatase SerB [bacterium]